MKTLANMLNDLDVRFDKYKHFVTFFFLHNEEDLKKLTSHWSLVDYPVDKVRSYFGEEIGFYFGFSKHYTIWLVGLVLMASLAQSYSLLSYYYGLPYDGYVMVLFSSSIIIWASLMMSYWKLEQERYGLDWGMLDFESKLKIRPEFQVAYKS